MRYRQQRILRDVTLHQREGLENQVIRIEIIRPFALHPFDFGLSQARLDGAEHTQRDFVLKRKDVLQLPLVTLAPKMAGALGLDQLSTDPNPVARLSHGTI